MGGLPHDLGEPDLGEGLQESSALRCPFLSRMHSGWLWGTAPWKSWGFSRVLSLPCVKGAMPALGCVECGLYEVALGGGWVDILFLFLKNEIVMLS